MTDMAGHHSLHHSRNSTMSSQEAQCVFLPSDEDWSQIEDKAKRRRVQNKAAQRRFRRKMRSQSSASDQQHDTIPLSSSATSNTDSLLPNLDLLRLSGQQHRSDPTTRERTPSLIWNSPNSISSHDTSTHAFLTYMRRNTDDNILASPGNYLSPESVSPRLVSDKSLHMVEDPVRLQEPDLLGHNHLTTQKLPSAAIDPAQSLSTNHTNRHAERLVNRIHNTLDELSMLYNIGIELELMQKDENMSAHLEALKRGFYNLATPTPCKS